MSIISWALFGLLAGAVAKMLMPGKDPGGCIITILLGVGGAMVGGFVGNFLGWGSSGSWSFKSFALAVVGAVILLALYRQFSDKKDD